MSSQTPHVQKVSDIVQVLNGGVEFYQEGLDKVSARSIKALFSRMIHEKKEAVTALQPYALAEQGESETHSDWAVDMRLMYTKAKGAISSDTDHTYVGQLEEVEDKVLQAIDNALEKNQPADCAAELRRIRSRMQQCHDEMKVLQEATA